MGLLDDELKGAPCDCFEAAWLGFNPDHHATSLAVSGTGLSLEREVPDPTQMAVSIALNRY